MPSLPLLLQEQARRRPDQPALVEKGRTLTFAQLEQQAAQKATLLREKGLKAGDGFLILLPPGVGAFVALLGAMRLGLRPLWPHGVVAPETVRRVCQRHKPKGMVGPLSLLPLRWASPELRAISVCFLQGFYLPFHPVWDDAPADLPMAHPADMRPDAPALTMFATTTGPEVMTHTHEGLLQAQESLAEALSPSPGVRHIQQHMLTALAHLVVGGTVVFPAEPVPTAAGLLAQTMADLPARLSVPADRVADFVSQAEARRLSLFSLRQLVVEGSVHLSLLERLQRLAPRADVLSLTGPSSLVPLAVFHLGAAPPSGAVLGHMRPFGVPLAGVSARVMKDQRGTALPPLTLAGFDRLTLPADHEGEVLFTGRLALEDDLTRPTVVDVEGVDWFRPGLKGLADARGTLWVAEKSPQQGLQNRP